MRDGAWIELISLVIRELFVPFKSEDVTKDNIDRSPVTSRESLDGKILVNKRFKFLLALFPIIMLPWMVEFVNDITQPLAVNVLFWRFIGFLEDVCFKLLHFLQLLFMILNVVANLSSVYPDSSVLEIVWSNENS